MWLAITAVIFTVTFLIGLFVTPAIVYVLGPALGPLRGPLGKMLFVVQQLTYGAGVMVERSVGGYEHCAADVDDEGNAHITLDGEEKVIERGSVGWAPLGWAPFALTYEKDLQSLEDFAEGREEMPVEERVEMPNGDTIDILDRMRGGYQLFAWAPDGDAIADGGSEWLIRMDMVAEWLGSKAGGPGLAERAEVQALKNYAGDEGLSAGIKAILIVVCLAIGSATGYLGVGL